MLKRNNDLINARGVANNPPISCDSPLINQDYASFINSLLPVQQGVPANRRRLPHNPSFELHPYLKHVSEEYFEKYIIGTFPPISYVIDELLDNNGLAITHMLQPENGIIARPAIPFFHGNRGLMWDYILTPDELVALNNILDREGKRDYLIDWLLKSKIIYSDIIFSTQRELENNRYTAKDTQLNNICINKDLICHILTNSNARYLMFNSSSTFGQNNWVNNDYSKSFDLFVKGCRELGLKVELKISQGPTLPIPWIEVNLFNAAFINQNFKNKIAFEMRLSITGNIDKLLLGNCLGADKFISKEFHVFTPISPAGIRGAALGNLIFQRWALLHNDGLINMGGLRNFLKDIFIWYKQNEIDQIYNLNIQL